ncbi:MAG: uridine kinase [Acidobacteriota bacterium]
MLIGVCGGTGSGKTTIARNIIDAVGQDLVVLLQQDVYYRDLSHISIEQRHQKNFDRLDALDLPLLVEHTRSLLAGKAVDQPIYDFATHTRTGRFLRLEARPIVLIEGILIFAELALRELMDLKVFVDTDSDIRFIRRLERDIRERGRTAEAVVHQYLTSVRPMYLELVEPSRRHADIIVPEGKHDHIFVELIVAWIKCHLQIPANPLTKSSERIKPIS